MNIKAIEECSYDDRPLVLIADDDVNFRLLARKALEMIGFKVEEAEDGEQVLERFDEHQPDIVLLDIVMPNKDGLMTCSELRSRPFGHYIPIVMVTGSDDIETISKAYEIGATDFITKPINWLILGHRVRFMLRTKQLIDEIVKNKLQSTTESKKIVEIVTEEREPSKNSLYVEWENNLRFLEKVTGIEALGKVIRFYVETTPELIRSLEESIVTEDYVTIRSIASRLRQNSSNLGITKFVSLCKELETTNNSSDIPIARSIASEIEREFNQIQKILKSKI